MKTNQWIISFVVSILMFLVVFYIGKTAFLPSLFCGLIGFVCSVLIGWNSNRNN